MTVQERTRPRDEVHFGGPGDFATVRHLVVRGTNHEIGHALGTIAIERYGRTPAHFAANPIFGRARRTYVQRQFPIQWQRLQGVAAAFGVDPEDDHYDFSFMDYLTDIPLPPFGCSVVYYPPATTAAGGGFLSRNYDFSVDSMAEMFGLPLPPAVRQQLDPVMSEPYVMEWYPADGGYASLAIHGFDTLAGTLDGINSAGLAVAILADNEATAELGPKLEPHPGPQQAVGLHELGVMRLLLDTCATVPEAEQALLTVKQYYRFVPCHYIVADKAGRSFVYENSTGRNVQHVIEGTGQPQAVTNFQLSRHPTSDTMPVGELTPQNEAFWRYRVLLARIADHEGRFTADEMKANNACVNIVKVAEAMGADPAHRDEATATRSRTLWHSLYDLEAGTVEVSFYLGEAGRPDGLPGERRSEYVTFALEAG